MKLYYSSASPFARFVRVIIRLLEIKTIDEVTINPLDNPEPLLEANPLGQVPCLILDDGAPIFDSEVIARYLDSEHGENSLFDSKASWFTRSQFALVKGMLDAAVRLRQEQLRAEDKADSLYWRQRYEQAILRGLQEFERIGLASHQQKTGVAIALVCLLEYLDFRHSELPWRNVAPGLALWLVEVAQENVFISTRAC